MKSRKEIVALGIFCCLLLTTYTSFSHIVTFIYEKQEQGFQQMGPVLLASNYFVFLVTNSVASGFLTSPKVQFLIAAICYSFNYFLQFLNLQGTTFGVILSIIGSGVGGYGAAILWINYGAYTKSLCRTNQEEGIQGEYFALLTSIAYISSILGPLVTTFALGFFSTQIYFAILTLLGIISFAVGYFFIKDIKLIQERHSNFDWKYQIINNCRYYGQMKSLLGILILDGLMLGFISSSTRKLLPPTSQNSLQIGLLLTVLGIGSIVGSILSGVLSDRYQMKNVGRSTIMSVLIAIIMSLIVIKVESIVLAFITAFLWGFALLYVEGWVYVACSRNFDGSLSSFANCKQTHSLSFCLYQVYLIITGDKISIYYVLLVLVLLTLPAFSLLNYLPQKYDKYNRGQALQEDSL